MHEAGPGVVNVYINYEKKFAFVEFRTGALPAMWPRHLQSVLWVLGCIEDLLLQDLC